MTVGEVQTCLMSSLVRIRASSAPYDTESYIKQVARVGTRAQDDNREEEEGEADHHVLREKENQQASQSFP